MKPNSLVQRYLPFLAIAALQLVLVATQPSGNGSAPVGGVSFGAPGSVASFGSQGQIGFDTAPGTQGAFVGGGGAAASGPGPGTAASGGPQAARGTGESVASTAAQQPLDALGRPLDGDKAKCAADGLVQQAFTRRQVPCMPKYSGDNGGATWQGVTREEIVAVVWFHKPNEEQDAVLASQGFAISPDQNEEINKLYEQFFNKHFELYGRKVRIEQFVSQCDGGDLECPRIEAKAINEKYHPFVVVNDVGAATPKSASEEFARMGVVVAGAPYGIGRKWFQQMAPFAWTYQIGGTESAESLGDYYCKRMHGKNAALAGDPLIQRQTRKLGIVVSEDPPVLERGEKLQALVSGGQCGSPADETTIYTLSTDSARAQEQSAALGTRLKNDGVTTVTGWTGYGCTTSCDQQNYYPENLMGHTGPWDVDPVARLVLNLFSSPAQARNLFGIGFYPWDPPTQEHDYARALRSVAPDYGEFPYIVEAIWDTVGILFHVMQFTGPNLTPHNMMQAAQNAMPQIGGYSNPNPWPGWTCCDPERLLVKYDPGSFSAASDGREVYWDHNAISKNDGRPGAFVCPDGECKRYEAGTWPAGDPRKA